MCLFKKMLNTAGNCSSCFLSTVILNSVFQTQFKIMSAECIYFNKKRECTLFLFSNIFCAYIYFINVLNFVSCVIIIIKLLFYQIKKKTLHYISTIDQPVV